MGAILLEVEPFGAHVRGIMSKDLEHGTVGFHFDNHAVAIVGKGEVPETGGSSSTQVDDVRFG